MNIEILQGAEQAKEAAGIAVVIDVFRAFSLECYLMSVGCSRILPVGLVDTARFLKSTHPEYVLIGERHGRILPGFDFGNSPSQVDAEIIRGKTIVHTTSAGTQGIAAASARSDEILAAGLVNAKATAQYILSRKPDHVSLICMGVEGMEPSPEDTFCGEYIKAMLLGSEIDIADNMQRIRNHKEGMKFFDPELQDVFPEKDFEMCTAIDRFDMVLRVNKIADDIFETRTIGPEGTGLNM